MERIEKFESVTNEYQGATPGEDRRAEDFGMLYEKESEIMLNGGVILGIKMLDLGMRLQKGWNRPGWVTRFEIKYSTGDER